MESGGSNINQTASDFMSPLVMEPMAASIVFNISSVKELFSFGSKLLASGLIDTIYQNVYLLIIGKYFSTQELGYYTRSYQFTFIPSQSITSIMSRVTYPVLSQIRDNPALLKESYKKMIKSIMLASFVLMLGMAAIAEPLIISLIGEKWRCSRHLSANVEL